MKEFVGDMLAKAAVRLLFGKDLLHAPWKESGESGESFTYRVIQPDVDQIDIPSFSREWNKNNLYKKGVMQLTAELVYRSESMIFVPGHSARVLIDDVRAYTRETRRRLPVIFVTEEQLPFDYIGWIKKIMKKNKGHMAVVVDDTYESGTKIETIRRGLKHENIQAEFILLVAPNYNFANDDYRYMLPPNYGLAERLSRTRGTKNSPWQ